MARSFPGPEVIDLCSEDERPASLSIQSNSRVYLTLSDDDDDESEPHTLRQIIHGQRPKSGRFSENHIEKPLTSNTLSKSMSSASNRSLRRESPLRKQNQGSPFSTNKIRSGNISQSTSTSSNNRNGSRTRGSGNVFASKLMIEIGDSEEERDRSKKVMGRESRSTSVGLAVSDKGDLLSLQKVPSKSASRNNIINHRQTPTTKTVPDDDSDEMLPSVEQLMKQSTSRPNTANMKEVASFHNSADVSANDTSPTTGRSRPPGSHSISRGLDTSKPRSSRAASSATSMDQHSSSPRVQSHMPISIDGPSSLFRSRAIAPKTINQIENWLEEYIVKVENEHSRNCIMALRRARIRTLHAKQTAKDEISPFESMSSVQTKHDERLPAWSSTTKIASYVYRKKVSRTYKQLIVTPALGVVPRVPKYNHHTAVTGNILEGDDDKLKYIPFFDDVDGCHDKVKEAAARKLERDLQEHHEQNVSASSRDSERDLRSQYCLTALLKHLHGICDLQSLTNYVLRHHSKESGLDNKQISVLLNIIKTTKRLSGDDVAKNICVAWESIFGFNVQYIVLNRDRIRDILESTEIPVQEKEAPDMPSPSQVIGTYTDMSCVICNTIHCQIHGGYQDKDNDNDDSDMDLDEDKKSKFQFRQHIVMLYDETLQRHDRRILSGKDNVADYSAPDITPCSDLCHLNNNSMEVDFEWPEETKGMLRALTVSRVPKAYEAKRPCYLSFALKQPCWQVFREMQRILPREPQANLPVRSRLNTMEWKDNKKWYDNETKTLRDKWWSQWTDAHDHQKRGHPEPCLHEGPCGKGCPCYEQNILCEFYCDCPSSCSRKFTGCPCHSRGINCVSETCICIQMNRECGPECADCGAIERLDPSNKYNDRLFTTGCQNVALQRGVGKRLFVGESMIENAGYGLFTGEPAKKGDFIEEYVGEVITWSEVARRGIHNGLKETSYLFDLNNTGAIDADRQANKTRYINHGDDKDPARNCEAKILWVRGEHRIKFIAARPIKEGEELLFDYGEEFITKAGLDKKLPESKKSRTRKVLEDAVGAEKALDDIVQGNSTGAGEEGTAIRAGRGGRGRKSRKITKPMRLEGVIHDDEDHDSDFLASGNMEIEPETDPLVSEDDDEEDIVSRVGKRKRIVPARYRK